MSLICCLLLMKPILRPMHILILIYYYRTLTSIFPVCFPDNSSGPMPVCIGCAIRLALSVAGGVRAPDGIRRLAGLPLVACTATADAAGSGVVKVCRHKSTDRSIGEEAG
jgi:hypothetical protein